MSELYTLPDGWEWKKLGKVLDVQNGYAFDSKLFNEEIGMQLIRIRDLKNGVITESKYSGEYDDKFLVYKGDFLIGMDGDFVCYIWKGEPSLLNQRVCRLVDFSNDLEAKYVFYGINKYLEDIHKTTAFVTVKHISSKQIKDIDFPLPPLEEQKRIVAKLDILFAKIDKAIALHQKNIDEANVFMASVLNDVFVELEEKYGLIEVGKVTDCIVPQRNKPKQFIGNIPWITTDDLELFKRISKSTKGLGLRREDIEEVKSKTFPKDSVLMSCVGDLGIVAIADDEIVVNQQLHTYQCKDNLVNTFLMYALYVKKDFMYQIANITTVAYMNKSKCNSIPVPLPPLKTQQKIVSYLDEISSNMEKIKQIQKEKMESLKALKASLLDQAFRGKL